MLHFLLNVCFHFIQTGKETKLVPAKEFKELSLLPRGSIQALGSSLQDQNFSLLRVINPLERKEKPHLGVWFYGDQTAQ